MWTALDLCDAQRIVPFVPRLGLALASGGDQESSGHVTTFQVSTLPGSHEPKTTSLALLDLHCVPIAPSSDKMDTQDAGLVLHSDLVKRLMRLRVIKDQIVQDVLTELDERQAELDTNSKVSEADGASVTKRPPTLILREDSLVRLSGWANSDEGKARLKTANLGESDERMQTRTRPYSQYADPYKYSLISLLAGTEVYVHSERLEVIRASENPDKVSLTSSLNRTGSHFHVRGF